MVPNDLSKGVLRLENGFQFFGLSIGASGVAEGTLCFNTAMSGYQEILSDPSYFGQIVVMTYPQIGNYGLNTEDVESRGVIVSGFIVHEYSEVASNWRSKKTLREYLVEKKIPALTGLDTRAITRHLRDKGAMNAYIVSPEPKNKAEVDEILKRLRAEPGFGARDLVGEVSCKEAYDWTESATDLNKMWGLKSVNAEKARPLVVVMDFGVKFNMLRSLVARGCRVKVVPSKTSAETILSYKPSGVLLSNGPGDPAMVQKAPDTVKQLLGRVPIFGICMGHQVLAHAIGAKTFKMKFGHHGANQPVLDTKSGRVMITSQNHGYAIDPKSLPAFAKVSQINLNDESVEGIELPEHKALSVQYHPEACPGPRDAAIYFDDFLRAMGYE